MKCVIFDLDGTLLDTSPGIIESVKYATEKLGYPPLSQDTLLSFIGPPLQDSFMHCYGCTRAKTEELTDAYREHYRAGALLHATPYDGIFKLLEKLRSAGFITSVATSKPQTFAEQILAHFDFHFHTIHGVDFAGKLGKADMIRLCIADADAAPSECFMIGDTEHDARGAKEAGVPFVGVSYGFGNPEEMKKYPSLGTAETPMHVWRILSRQIEGV